ncbi:hypothetical protein [Gordonia sp. NPDC058843]|uniref:hypothetical protein n=1 Tax=Gordonia sp. NPDC058843 TaxID=3346648 RepID=UPI0036A9A92B
MSVFDPGHGVPEYLKWPDAAYARYVEEICAVGRHMRGHLIDRNLAQVTRGAQSGRQLAQAVFELDIGRHAGWKAGSRRNYEALGPLEHRNFLHRNGFICDHDMIVINADTLDRKRRWLQNPRLVAPRKAIGKGRASWYDPADIIEFSRPSILPIVISLTDLVSRHQDGDPVVGRFVNSRNVVVATDIGQIGHVWDYRRLAGLFRVGRRIGSSDCYFESIPSLYGRVLAREVIAAQRTK